MFRSRCTLSHAVAAATPRAFASCRACSVGLMRPSRVLCCATTAPHVHSTAAGARGIVEPSKKSTSTTTSGHENVFSAEAPPTMDAMFAGSRLAADTPLSHGEEEVQEGREHPADDWQHSDHDYTDTRSFTTEVSAVRRGAVTDTPQDPVNLFGALYVGTMADTLRTAAEQQGFYSPFWSSRAAFASIGAEVEVGDDDGLVLPTSTSIPARLFNLEQTTLADQFRLAVVGEVRAYVQRQRQSQDKVSSYERPRNICGRYLSASRAEALAASPNFFAWQQRNPSWLSENDIEGLNAQVCPGEEGKGISVPAGWTARSSGLTFGAAPTEDTEGEKQIQMYNVLQVVDMEARVARMPHPLWELGRCCSVRGVRYGAATTWLMWEYCLRFHFPLREKTIVMLTIERIRALGGTVLKTKRYPESDTNKRVRRSKSHTTTTTTHPATTDAVAEAEGVVPPPFTLIMSDEVISLYNAHQTDIPDIIFGAVEERLHGRQSRGTNSSEHRRV